jgi:hypothetical protein
MANVSIGGAGLVSVSLQGENIDVGPVSLHNGTVTVDLASFLQNPSLPGAYKVTVGVPSQLGVATVVGTGDAVAQNPNAVVGIVSSLPGAAVNTVTGLLGNLSSAPGEVASAIQSAAADPASAASLLKAPTLGYSAGVGGVHLQVDNAVHPITVDFKTGL